MVIGNGYCLDASYGNARTNTALLTLSLILYSSDWSLLVLQRLGMGMNAFG